MKLLIRCVLLIVVVCAVRSTTTKYFTFEEDGVGTEIGNLSKDLKINPAEDPETSFRFMQKTNSSLIQMRQMDGLLTIGEAIDRERLCNQSPQCLVTFDVVAFSKEKFQLIHVEIEVRDVNDHSPQFPKNETLIEISENVAVNTRFPLDIAVDQDVGSNYIQSYHISHNDHFVVDVHTGDDGEKHGELVLVKTLDRETEDSYTFELVATDGGNPPKSGTTKIIIKVLDFNDNSPTFEHNSLKVELQEDSPVGYRVLKVHAFDPDDGINGEVVYGFVKEASFEVTRLFHIDSHSGEVTLKEMVDFEKRQSYELNIQASDLGVNSVPSTCRVLIDILDVNDNAPVITIKPMTSTSDGVAFITEAAAEESFVALISTSDRDSGPNGYVRSSLSGHEHFRLQQAYGDTFMIVTTAGLDREKIAEYNLTVVAEDLGSPPFKTVKHYTIKVTDENDNAPVFSKSNYDVSVVENNIPGSYITTVVARDVDTNDNGKVVYSLIDSKVLDDARMSTFISVDPLSGSVYSLRSFDFETLKHFEFTVQASDKGSPSQSSTSVVKVTIVDENDNYPYFTNPVLQSDSADVQIPLNAPPGYLALQVKAQDEDSGVNSEVSFQILEDNYQNFFSMDKKSGEIVLKQSLNAQREDVLEIKIAVYDNGRSPLSSKATIRFIVTDTEPSQEQAVISLRPSDEDYFNFGASTVSIVTISGGCALLLITVASVIIICKFKGRKFGSKKDTSRGLYGSTPLSIHSAASANIYGGPRSLFSNDRDFSLHYQYEEKNSESDAKLFLPSKPFGQTPLWQEERHCLQRSCIGNTDQLSVKDSGKGDSDFNDSDSDTSGEAFKRNLTTFQPWTKSSVNSTNTLGFEWQGRQSVTHAGPACNRTMGFPQPPAYSNTQANPPSWRDSCYNTSLPKARSSMHSISRTGTLPSYFSHQKRGMTAKAEEQRQQNREILTVATLSEVATTF
ncbi:protocadherin-8 [Chanos chanos]|uniref:Protocadherin beta-1 n=1 Tax=Chanos chanos TaxID=29144 RepID=A0A6J2WGE0_CHACN|nr:protocadherin-8-like [Chanos chanos]